jgi:hypothetical protein
MSRSNTPPPTHHSQPLQTLYLHRMVAGARRGAGRNRARARPPARRGAVQALEEGQEVARCDSDPRDSDGKTHRALHAPRGGAEGLFSGGGAEHPPGAALPARSSHCGARAALWLCQPAGRATGQATGRFGGTLSACMTPHPSVRGLKAVSRGRRDAAGNTAADSVSLTRPGSLAWYEGSWGGATTGSQRFLTLPPTPGLLCR